MTSFRLFRGAKAIAGAALVSAAVLAPAQAHADAADDVVLALHYDQYYNSIATISVGQALARLQANGLAGADLDTAKSKLNAEAAAYRKIFLGQVAASYRSHFSSAELAQLLAFYRSPLGEKVGATQSSIRDDVSTATRNTGVYLGVAAAQLAK